MECPLTLVVLLIASLLSWDSGAQQSLDRTATSRGRIADASGLLEAQDAVARVGVDRVVQRAVVRASNSRGERHYEVACSNGLGYFVVTGRSEQIHSCLLLASQYDRLAQSGESTRNAPICELATNADRSRQLAGIARDAGLTCEVDGGRVVGVSPIGSPIYEVGCRDEVGAWIERSPGGWSVVDCIEVRARNDACNYTSSTEEAVVFGRWLNGSAAGDCAPVGVEAMGRNAAGTVYYEVTCTAGDDLVVGLSPERQVTSVRRCAEAAHIGNGCRNARP